MRNKFLKTSRLFRDMSQNEIDSALTALDAKYYDFEKGENILHAGDKTDSVCVVTSGSVTIESNDMWGNRTILNIMGTGDFFAESYAVLKDETLLVDVVANETCCILFLRISGLFTMEDSQSWQNKLVRNLLMISAGKNLMLSGRSFHTSPNTTRGRIMAYLNSVSLKRHGTIFDIPFDRQQLADYLNLERTALSKELGKMKREGIIDFQKNHFKIISADDR